MYATDIPGIEEGRNNKSPNADKSRETAEHGKKESETGGDEFGY